MALDLEAVIKQLNDSSIIAPGKLEKFIPPKTHPKSVKELTEELVKSGNLTPFQAQHVNAGKTKSLLLGAYTIIDKIGAGGMGQVFKAQHRRMERIVAIKLLPPAMTKDAAAVARFHREVKAAAKLEHTNIVAAHDADEANGAHFLVMQYIEGKDLSVLVKKNGPFPVSKAVSYILQAAKGLEFAHSEGVIHRDIKPANLLLDKKGVVKILDMGLARIESDGGLAQAELTGSGTIMGTVDYMAPEQGLSTKHADARADIYSLGCSLYYLIAGKATYDGETVAAKLLAHHTHPVPSLSEAHPDVPEQVEAVFKKMVAKKLEDRYQTMTEVVADLEKCQSAINAAATSSTGVWKPETTSGDSEIAAFFGSQKLKRISDDPFAVDEPPKKERRKKAGGKAPPWKNSKMLIGAGAAGMLAVLLGVIVIFRNDKGEEIGRMELPEGTSVEVRPGKPAVVATALPATPPKPLLAPFDLQQAKAGQNAWARYLKTTVEQKNLVGMTLALIPPGEFMMGSTPEQNAVARKMGEDDEIASTDYYFQRLPEEMPQHRVTINLPFLIGSTEVTIGQFRKFVEASKYVTEAEQYGFGNSGDERLTDKVKEADKGKNWKSPGYAVTDDAPVTQITWNDACAYCSWLSEQEQRRPWYRTDAKGRWLIVAHADGYRLPTEAEWEYSCRAGTTTLYSFGDDKALLEQHGWFGKNAGGKAQPVASKRPNPFGLFDIHGNAQEWCQDWYESKWYDTSSPSDSFGPSSGSNHVIRGGNWISYAPACRSAYRLVNTPSYRYHYFGFRIVRPLDSTRMEAGLAATATTPAVAPATPTKPWQSPVFQQWVKETQALTAEKQIEAVSKKLMELNPGFDGKVRAWDIKDAPKIKNGQVDSFGFTSDHVTDLSPVRVFSGLIRLNGSASARGKGMLSDLSPLQGMSLNRVAFNCTKISNLSPLEECKELNLCTVMGTNVLPAQVAALQKALPNCKIEWDDPAKTSKSWESPAFQAWIKEVQALPAEKQVEAVSKKLVELNPGFDGKMTDGDGKGTPKIESGVVTELIFISENVADISPVRSLLGLKVLRCSGRGAKTSKLSDLSPLQGMQLKTLEFSRTPVRDLSPLRGMPLTNLRCDAGSLSDLSPLEDLGGLKIVSVTGTGVTAAAVAALQKALPNCKILSNDPAKPKTPAPVPAGKK